MGFGIFSKIKNCTINCLALIGLRQLWWGEQRKLKDPRRKKLISSVHLTKEQRNKIDEFYLKNYGQKIPHDWHRLYQSFTGVFNEEYIPEILFSTKYEPKASSQDYAHVLSDKTHTDLFSANVHNVSRPKIYGTYCNFVYFDNDKQVYTEDEFINMLADVGEVIIKPTQDTNSGNGVQLLDVHNCIDTRTNLALDEIINGYQGKPFQVQQRVINHESIRKLYPHALNTFRIITYIWKGKVYHCPVTLKIGRDGNFLDNVHAGGMFIHVNDDGVLYDTAYTEFQITFTSHPDTGTVFKGYQIPYVRELIKTAKIMHLNSPNVSCVSWDLAIDHQDKFILVEANLKSHSTWFPQMASGKALFGENTAEILQYISSKRKKQI